MCMYKVLIIIIFVSFIFFRNGDVRTKEEFLQQTPGQSWKRWAVQTVVVNPLYWSFNKLKQTIGYEQNDIDVLDNKEYVHIPAIKVTLLSIFFWSC